MGSKVAAAFRHQYKQRKRDESPTATATATMKQEIVVQVHKPTGPPENANGGREAITVGEGVHVHTPSREVSVDEESQINSKILSLIETEMRRDLNKHSSTSHFSDSRPQSLSFYEEERAPEELSGNLELLSPEERRHYKRRKDLDTEERNAYNAIQDLYERDGDDLTASASSKKASKSSRKKRHGDGEHGMGDSREMMIPKEKKRSKKKSRREGSPASANNNNNNNSGKRSKHRNKSRPPAEDVDHEGGVVARGEVQLALDELQDDVFENDDTGRGSHFVHHHGHHRQQQQQQEAERMKKSPRRSERVYVQKKNRFEATGRRQPEEARVDCDGEVCGGFQGKRIEDFAPIELAACVQKHWLPFATLCHGLLGGLSLAHFIYLRNNYFSPNLSYVADYASFSDIYTCLFYFLCIVCLVSVFDRYDLSHMDVSHFRDLVRCKKSAFVIVMYVACLLLHLWTARLEEKISLLTYDSTQIANITKDEVRHWNNLSFSRGIIAFFAWVVVGLCPVDDMLYVHLKNMEKYVVAPES